MDIVTILRETADDCENMERWALPELAPMMRKAASEIERLRAEILIISLLYSDLG